MAKAPAPQPATELFSESLQLSLKQREVLDALQAFPQGAGSAELAATLGMHVNTARGHLDELVARGAVRVSSLPAEGRGRPSFIFQVRVPDNRAVADEYVSLVEVLASMVADTDSATPENLSLAHDIGRKWARRMAQSAVPAQTVADVLPQLLVRLRDMGFDPVLTPPQSPEDGHQVALHSCPFITGDSLPTPFICAVHEGFLQETVGETMAATSGRVSLTLLPFSGEGACVVEVDSDAKKAS